LRAGQARKESVSTVWSCCTRGCPLVNPLNTITREQLPEFFTAVLAIEPDIRVAPTRWPETDDGVLIEWVNTGTLQGDTLELRGADRYTLKDGKATEGYAYSTRVPSSTRGRRRPRRKTAAPRPRECQPRIETVH
jgi:SnoaL-like domain